MAEPWDRQPGETAKNYEAFCAYRDLGPNRSIPKAGAIVGKAGGTLEPWSSKFNWRERAAQWDAEQDRIMRQEQLNEIKKMRKRHADLGYSMLIKAAQALKKIKDDEIKAGDVSRMVEVASRLERLSRGDTSEVIEERDGGEAINPVQIYLPDNQRGKDRDSFDDLEV